jgi:hypothetical protein
MLRYLIRSDREVVASRLASIPNVVEAFQCPKTRLENIGPYLTKQVCPQTSSRHTQLFAQFFKSFFTALVIALNFPSKKTVNVGHNCSIPKVMPSNIAFLPSSPEPFEI